MALPLLVSMAACGGADQPPPLSPAAPPASAPLAIASPQTPSASPAPTDTTSAAATPPAAPTSAVATVKSDDSWVDCHRSYKAKLNDVSKDVAAMAASCKSVTKLTQVGSTLKGKQGDNDPPQTFPLDAKGGHCYRAYAQASDGIKDLDLIVKDSAGIVIGQDSTDDPSPVAMEYGALCFSKDDKASIVIAVGAGKGDYAIQIWSD
jgi:hypothetical protein